MYPTRDERLDDIYFMRRMAEARRAPQITASMAFDLADSPMDDDALELATEGFGATAGDRGLGMSDIMEELLSRNPSSVPAGSVRTIQARLQAQGYAPPGATPDGHWSPTWASAFRRSDRDAQTAHAWGPTCPSRTSYNLPEVFGRDRSVRSLAGDGRYGEGNGRTGNGDR